MPTFGDKEFLPMEKKIHSKAHIQRYAVNSSKRIETKNN